MDNVLKGIDTTSPYSGTWSNVPIGFHAVKAVATDNGSLTTTSTVVNFSVVANPGYGALSFDDIDDHVTIFPAQTNWIVNNRVARNIAYVAGEGDVVNVGSGTTQYDVATAAYALLENPATTGLAQGVAFGVPVGNHDASPYTVFISIPPPSAIHGLPSPL